MRVHVSVASTLSPPRVRRLRYLTKCYNNTVKEGCCRVLIHCNDSRHAGEANAAAHGAAATDFRERAARIAGFRL
jgi:hypothetical protein